MDQRWSSGGTHRTIFRRPIGFSRGWDGSSAASGGQIESKAFTGTPETARVFVGA
jgi:hypothetical protein